MHAGEQLRDDTTVNTLPTRARSYFSNRDGSLVKKYQHGTKSRRNTASTRSSRTEHFVSYLRLLGLDHTLKSYSAATQTRIAIYYCADVADGLTLTDKMIRLNTLKGYMEEAAKYALQPENAGRDIRLEPIPGLHPWQLKTHPLLQDIYAHCCRWQGKTNRKDELSYLIIAAI